MLIIVYKCLIFIRCLFLSLKRLPTNLIIPIKYQMYRSVIIMAVFIFFLLQQYTDIRYEKIKFIRTSVTMQLMKYLFFSGIKLHSRV